MSESLGIGGGPVAIRGFMVQTLIGLLEILRANPPFESITFEPNSGEDKFDYMWSNSSTNHAVQVKSSTSSFSIGQVKEWASQMKSTLIADKHSIVLVGNHGPSLDNVDVIENVSIDKNHGLSIQSMIDQADHKISIFMESQELNTGSSTEREKIVYALIGKLTHLSISSTTLTRFEFTSLLKDWIVSTTNNRCRVNIDFDIESTGPITLVGREDKIAYLDESWQNTTDDKSGKANIITIVGLGGEGKTALVAKWLGGMAREGWPTCTAVFGWSFYQQHNAGISSSSDMFFDSALSFLDNENRDWSSWSQYEKAKQLADLVNRTGVLVVLDGVETLQYAPTDINAGAIFDTGLRTFVGLLASTNRGLCVITTRYPITSIKNYWETTTPHIELGPLTEDASLTLLQQNNIHGRHEDLIGIARTMQGHALSLTLVSSYLAEAHGGNALYWTEVKLNRADIQRGGHAFRVLDAYVSWLGSDSERGIVALALLRLLAFFDRPVSIDLFDVLLSRPGVVELTDVLTNTGEPARRILLERLRKARLLSIQLDDDGSILTLDTHPLIREYFGVELRTKRLEAWREGHTRLFEFLSSSTKEKELPDASELRTLYQAIFHACAAGLHSAAYDVVLRKRIHKGGQYYSQNVLGLHSTELRALSCFYDTPWSKISDELSPVKQVEILDMTAHLLAHLGRLKESCDVLDFSLGRRGYSKAIPLTATSASIPASNLSHIRLQLGRIKSSISTAQIAVELANIGGDSFHRISKRTRLANAYFFAGDYDVAGKLFDEAEDIQRQFYPAKYLYSEGHYLYTNFLLRGLERGCWVWVMNQRTAEDLCSSVNIELCERVLQRGMEVLKYYESNPIRIDAAYEYLAVSKTMVWRTVLGQNMLEQAHGFLSKAIGILRSSGSLVLLVDALMTRALMGRIRGGTEKTLESRLDLDEAWSIASAGLMKPLMSEIRLCRARLHGYESQYPWESPIHDIGGAEVIIGECNYGRRTDEVQDAKLYFH